MNTQYSCCKSNCYNSNCRCRSKPVEIKRKCCPTPVLPVVIPTPDLIASVGVNPSQIIVAGTAPLPGPPVPPSGNIKINFNNIYVNQPNTYVAPNTVVSGNYFAVPYNTARGGYIVLNNGIYEIDLNVNLFLLILGLPAVPPALPPGPSIQLTNLVRYTLSVFAQKSTGAVVQLASKSGLFNRTGSLPDENNGAVYAINDIQANSLTFDISTNPNQAQNISVGDLIYATVAISTPPVGNYSTYNVSVTSSGRGESQTISASFLNVKRIAAL